MKITIATLLLTKRDMNIEHKKSKKIKAKSHHFQ